MAYILFAFVLMSCSLFAIYLSYYYGQWKKQPILCTISYTMGWLISFLFIGVLPIDISSTFAYQNEINNVSLDLAPSYIIFVDMHILNVFWICIYWTAQLLTWIVLPIMESYAGSGEFTVLRKFRSAIIDNAIIYGSYFTIFICVLIYLFVNKAISFNASALKVLLITTSNTWGLFLVILFLGYGLVEVPRSILIFASPDTRLRFAYFTLSKRYLEYIEDEEEMKNVLTEVRDLDYHIAPDHSLRSLLNIVVIKAAVLGKADGVVRWNQRENLLDTSGAGAIASTLTSKRLVRLHKRLKRAYHHRSRAHALWLEALRHAASAEDVFNNCIADSSRVFERGHAPFVLASTEVTPKPRSLCERLTGAAGVCTCSFEWYWRCRFQPLLLKILAVLLAVASFLVVWSECTFFVRRPRLSIIAAILHSRPTLLNYYLIAFVCFLFLGYVGYCVCFTAYRLRFFNYYRLVPNHHSDAISLVFYGSMLCRLAPSLCVNYLCLAHLDSHVLQNLTSAPTILPNSSDTVSTISGSINGSAVYETSFTKFMGHLDVISFIANGFNIYFPMIVLLLCLVTLFRIGSRLLASLGMPHLLGPSFIYKHLPAGEGSPVEDAVEDGRMLLYRERTLGRTRHRVRGNDGPSNTPPGRDVFQPHSTPSATLQNLKVRDDMDVDQIFGPEQPVVEFSDEKMNAMFGFNLPDRQVGSSRNEYTILGGKVGESRPLVSKAVSSLNKFFQPR